VRSLITCDEVEKAYGTAVKTAALQRSNLTVGYGD
jgi:hypothetical protein